MVRSRLSEREHSRLLSERTAGPAGLGGGLVGTCGPGASHQSCHQRCLPSRPPLQGELITALPPRAVSRIRRKYGACMEQSAPGVWARKTTKRHRDFTTEPRFTSLQTADKPGPARPTCCALAGAVPTGSPRAPPALPPWLHALTQSTLPLSHSPSYPLYLS